MARYTKPELREQLKEEIKASDKGGKQGQWSARKSQLLTREYQKHGGGYEGPKDQRQKALQRSRSSAGANDTSDESHPSSLRQSTAHTRGLNPSTPRVNQTRGSPPLERREGAYAI